MIISRKFVASLIVFTKFNLDCVLINDELNEKRYTKENIWFSYVSGINANGQNRVSNYEDYMGNYWDEGMETIFPYEENIYTVFNLITSMHIKKDCDKFFTPYLDVLYPIDNPEQITLKKSLVA
tara:strand:+ start:9758 stop:10129 length:372 start_codon:yes stop_codon:yes gene_type:complete